MKFPFVRKKRFEDVKVINLELDERYINARYKIQKLQARINRLRNDQRTILRAKYQYEAPTINIFLDRFKSVVRMITQLCIVDLKQFKHEEIEIYIAQLKEDFEIELRKKLIGAKNEIDRSD